MVMVCARLLRHTYALVRCHILTSTCIAVESPFFDSPYLQLLLHLYLQHLLSSLVFGRHSATMAFGSTALKFFQTLLYTLAFCCAAIILGIYSYFMSVLADRDIAIPRWTQAVEGISAIGVLYTIFAILLTCFLGGKTFFAFLAIVLDILLCGGFIAIAVLTRDGASNCRGNVRTPLGNGPAASKQGFSSNNGAGDQVTYAASLGTTCRLNTAVFAVAIAGALLFLISAIVQIFLARKHKKDKRFGPGPSNGYTRGTGGKFWQRGGRKNKGGLRDPEMAGTVPATGTLAAGHHDVRPSHDTAYTGTTAARDSTAYENPHKPVNAGYYTAPTGTHAASMGTYAAPTAAPIDTYTAPTGTYPTDTYNSHTTRTHAATNY
ncbi:hypothetical protein BDV95DRAFT_586734 [Massariosphaeria phaeospora]|uniref:MARVEL domain-containing protein n=1 Tax=Massariosphaeria phaeospora TaxID=100035 RepID=A0A7C8HYQ2_9PLEO|nr:hypothetical protein BDV95DRAFT_586734 [Massariosphaeria phaeospora]